MPKHFTVNYSINPWMNTSAPVNPEKALKQWNTLRQAIIDAGATVEVMDPAGADHYPDLVFTANAAVVRGKKAFMANFYYPQCKGERYFYEKWFKDHGYDTMGSYEVPFEGAGDGLWIGENDSKLACGIGPRTDVRALRMVADKLQDAERPFTTIGCRLVDPRFYHIDTCFCPIASDVALWYQHAFDHITQHNLSNDVELLPVSEKEALQFACNAVVVGKTVIMNVGNTITEGMLKQVGYDTVFVEMSEFIKSGGSSKCCTLAL